MDPVDDKKTGVDGCECKDKQLIDRCEVQGTDNHYCNLDWSTPWGSTQNDEDDSDPRII